jgi:hypothetical protein
MKQPANTEETFICNKSVAAFVSIPSHESEGLLKTHPDFDFSYDSYAIKTIVGEHHGRFGSLSL